MGARGFQKLGSRVPKWGPEVCRKKGPGCQPVLLGDEISKMLKTKCAYKFQSELCIVTHEYMYMYAWMLG